MALGATAQDVSARRTQAAGRRRTVRRRMLAAALNPLLGSY